MLLCSALVRSTKESVTSVVPRSRLAGERHDDAFGGARQLDAPPRGAAARDRVRAAERLVHAHGGELLGLPHAELGLREEEPETLPAGIHADPQRNADQRAQRGRRGGDLVACELSGGAASATVGQGGQPGGYAGR